MVDKRKPAGSWSSVKAELRSFDRTALLGLIQDLYAANKNNKAFLHARLNLGDDPLKPYKVVISRWMCPHVFKNQPVSVAKAKKAISDYKVPSAIRKAWPNYRSSIARRRSCS